MVPLMNTSPNTDSEQPEVPDTATHFGYREVPSAEKSGLVRDVFDSVAERYDLMNDVLSGGVHRLWKNALVDWLHPRPGMSLLDMAGGTGDIARRIQARTGGKAEVTVCDINMQMLHAGQQRADNTDGNGISRVAGDAESLPFPDESFEAYTIAFGIRNVTHIDAALREARRVLKPGGRFMCLEFSTVELPGLDRLYDLHSFKLMPRLGEWIAGNREAYQYLAESIRRFPNQQTFARMIADAGLSQVKFRNQSAGIAAIHSAWRI